MRAELEQAIGRQNDEEAGAEVCKQPGTTRSSERRPGQAEDRDDEQDVEDAQAREAEQPLDPVQTDVRQPGSRLGRAYCRMQQRVCGKPGPGRRVGLSEGQAQPSVFTEDWLPRGDEDERHQRQGPTASNPAGSRQVPTPRSTEIGNPDLCDRATDRS